MNFQFLRLQIWKNILLSNNLFKHGDKYYRENEYIPYGGIVFDVSKETRNKTLQFRMIDRFKNGS